MICCGDAPVPKARVFDGAPLGAEVDVGEAVTLGVAVGPLEVIDQTPGVIGTDLCSVGYGARELGENLLVEGGAALVRNVAGLVGAVEITAAVFADLDDGVVVIA